MAEADEAGVGTSSQSFGWFDIAWISAVLLLVVVNLLLPDPAMITSAHGAQIGESWEQRAIEEDIGSAAHRKAADAFMNAIGDVATEEELEARTMSQLQAVDKVM